jgi:ribosomal protein L21E
MYNQAALEVTGAPIIEKYEFGDEIKVKFSSSMMTDKVSKRFTKKINDAGGWYTVTKGSGKQATWEVGDNFKFEA